MKAVIVENLTKAYRVKKTTINALRGISFDLEKGRTLGVVGDNGSGKSTLLKILSGISRPTSGRIELSDKIGAILDISAGLNAYFTGRANVYMRCAILGYSKKETDYKFDEILNFSELGSFIDQPLYMYSSGMFMRLGFSIAISSIPEIILIDEVLGVGDQYFQRKCFEYLKNIRNKGTTIIFASHDLSKVNTFCDKVLWLNGGVVEMAGEPVFVIPKYIDCVREKEGRISEFLKAGGKGLAPEQDKASGDLGNSNIWGSGEIRIVDVKLLDARGEGKAVFKTGESMTVEVLFEAIRPVESPTFGVAIFRNDGVYCYGPNTRLDNRYRDKTWRGKGKYSITYDRLVLLPGSYQISVGVYDKDEIFPYAFHHRLYDFKVASDIQDHGLVFLDHNWHSKELY